MKTTKNTKRVFPLTGITALQYPLADQIVEVWTSADNFDVTFDVRGKGVTLSNRDVMELEHPTSMWMSKSECRSLGIDDDEAGYYDVKEEVMCDRCLASLKKTALKHAKKILSAYEE
jgi:hypothetical protein